MTETAATAPSTPTNKMTLKDFFESEKLFEYALLDFEETTVTDEGRAKRLFEDFDCKTVALFVIPYKVKEVSEKNISRYAFARDYHLYFKELSERLSSHFPSLFRSSCDTSPINEVEAAVKAGLGSFGRHGLLINRRYGSYVFVGEFFSSLPKDDPIFEGIKARDRGHECLGCGACERVCPTSAFNDKTKCVSHINQKKRLDDGDEEIIRSSALLWGCDICQEVCPINLGADETEIPFFLKNLTPLLSHETLDTLIEKGEFDARAYAWRGEKTLRRNLDILYGERK